MYLFHIIGLLTKKYTQECNNKRKNVPFYPCKYLVLHNTYNSQHTHESYCCFLLDKTLNTFINEHCSYLHICNLVIFVNRMIFFEEILNYVFKHLLSPVFFT